MKPANYQQSYQKLLSLSGLKPPLLGSHAKTFAAKKEACQSLLNHLGNPEKSLRFVHVTGTSGKGTVTNLVLAALVADGKKAASFSTPHTTTYVERFKIGNKLARPQDLVASMEAAMKAYEFHIQEGGRPLGFLTLSLCIALHLYAAQKVTHVVVEVGCGGRFDITNIIPSKEVAIITNVGLDHVYTLGKTKEKIAWHKAGLMARGVPTVTGETNPAILAIIAKEAKQKKSPLYVVPPPKKGGHRLHNALIATKAALLLGVPEETLMTAIEQTKPLPCRLEIIAQGPRVIIDGAHNYEKLAATVQSVRTLAKGDVHVIFGCTGIASQPGQKLLKMLVPLAKTVRTTRFTHAYCSAINPYSLLPVVPQKKQRGAFLFPHDALDDVLKEAKTGDTILITGSLYLAGELRTHWVSEEQILKNQSSYKAEA